MNQLAVQLDEKLRSLDRNSAQYLELLVREALDKAEQSKRCAAALAWPAEYFQQTSGALAGEEFERPSQGEFPHRDEW